MRPIDSVSLGPSMTHHGQVRNQAVRGAPLPALDRLGLYCN